MNLFSMPRDIYFGKGSLKYLQELRAKRAIIIVGSGSMKRLGFLDKALGYLKVCGIETEVLSDVEPDPSLETVLRGKEAMQVFGPDWIIALGGGSVIDAAKAMWVFYEHPELSFEDSVRLNGIPAMRTKSRFLAIPSTSGTASEVTSSAVISDYNSETKYALDSKELIPDIAILDPELAEAMPAHIAAYTGMDALTHAMEALVATLATPFSTALAIESSMLIFENLSKSVSGDAVARENMHYAQCMAGMAFSNSMLGISHSMSHAVGLTFKIAHGVANALFLPYVIQFNQKTSSGAYGGLARHIKLPGSSDYELTQQLCQSVINLNKEIKLPVSLKEYGIERKMFEKELPCIVEKAMADACTETNPRPCSPQEMEKIFDAAFNGDNIDF